jgi:hypothetical protein
VVKGYEADQPIFNEHVPEAGRRFTALQVHQLSGFYLFICVFDYLCDGTYNCIERKHDAWCVSHVTAAGSNGLFITFLTDFGTVPNLNHFVS